MSNPDIPSGNRFFSNIGERIVFWVAIAGLILVASLSMFRNYQMKKTVEEYHSAQGHHRQVLERNKILKEVVETYKARLDSIGKQLNNKEKIIDSLKTKM